MNLERFQEFHPRLLAMAAEAGTIEGLEARVVESLAGAGRRILENRYRLTMVSPFQGGKSTIFNAVCGGRELSPTGAGIKTSACIAEAHYLDDGEEYAEIEWRTDEELILGFINVLQPHIEVDPAGEGASDLAGRYQLSSPGDRAKLAEFLAMARAQYEGNRLAFPAEQVEILTVCELVLSRYESVGVPSRETLRLPVEAAGRWIRFPEGWGIRPADDFGDDELVFLFLKRVKFQIRSEALRRLQAVLVDCPGLFATAYDERVTRECVRSADAVLFLLGTRGTAINEQQVDAAKKFAELNLTDGLFLGFNIMNRGEWDGVKWRRNDLAQLASIGIDVPEERTSIFNALLALRARQAAMVGRGETIPEGLLHAFATRAKDYPSSMLPDGGADPTRTAEFLIARELKQSFESFTGRDWIGGLTEANVRAADHASKWEDLLIQAAEFVVEHKAKAILVDHGASLLIKILDRARADLINQIEGAKVDSGALDDLEAAFREVLPEIDEKQASICLEFRDFLRRGTVDPLVRELRDELRRKEDERRGKVIEAVDKSSSESVARARVMKQVEKHVKRRVGDWHQSLRKGSSLARSTFVPALRRSNEGLKALREMAGTRLGTLFDGVEIAPESAEEFDALMETIEEVYKKLDLPDPDIDTSHGVAQKPLPRKQSWWDSIRESVSGSRAPEPAGAWKPAYKQWAGEIADDFFEDDHVKTMAHCHVTTLMEKTARRIERDFEKVWKDARKELERKLRARRTIFEAGGGGRVEFAEKAGRVLERLEPVRMRLEAFAAEVVRAIEEDE